MIKSNTFIRKAKDISINGALALLLLGQGAAMQSCSNNNDSEGDYEVTESYARGVKTYIKEVATGEFKITDEIDVPADSSQAIITYLDGHQEVLSKEKSKELIDKEIATNQAGIGHHNGLSNVLLYGGMGYFLGRTISPGYSAYRQDLGRDDQRSSGYYGGGVNRGQYYTNETAYQKSNSVHESISKSRTVVSRPSGGRSGFFGGSSRGGFRG